MGHAPHARADSAASALFKIWLPCHLRRHLLDRVVRDDATLRPYMTPGNIPTVVRLLPGKRPGLAKRAGLETAAKRTAFLAKTMNAAWQGPTLRLGPNPDAWRWGDLHKGYFDPAMTPICAGRNVDPLLMRGSSTNVMLGHYKASDSRTHIGASAL